MLLDVFLLDEYFLGQIQRGHSIDIQGKLNQLGVSEDTLFF